MDSHPRSAAVIARCTGLAGACEGQHAARPARGEQEVMAIG
jgi:hypothetical protein